MNANGKAMRRQSGQNRHSMHFASHTHKSADKRRKMHWGKKGSI